MQIPSPRFLKEFHTLNDKPTLFVAIEERNPDGAELKEAGKVADHVVRDVGCAIRNAQ